MKKLKLLSAAAVFAFCAGMAGSAFAMPRNCTYMCDNMVSQSLCNNLSWSCSGLGCDMWCMY